MHKIFGFTLSEWGVIFTLISLVFGGCMALIRYFKASISEPLTRAIEELGRDLQESKKDRKENEKKLFEVTDDHSKELIKMNGRINTLEVSVNSNTIRIDHIEERNFK
ncbi:hypothetical protein LMK05_05825 [Lactococcus petauri]|nr:hypothetical protein LMK05_05825 [Lactococcus petauri]